jgi:hypothetical protein
MASLSAKVAGSLITEQTQWMVKGFFYAYFQMCLQV